MSTVVVIDTSYICEEMRIPDYFNDKDAKEIKKRFIKAAGLGWEFFLPLPCLFELADHITDVGHALQRRQLSAKLQLFVTASLNGEGPWIIWPAPSSGELAGMFEKWANANILESVGLTDTFTEQTALHLKQKYHSFGYRVYIWTKDNALKAREPDAEPNPFTGH